MTSHSHTCAIALGSNLGNSRKTLESALETLNRTPSITVKAHSSWYQTQPVNAPPPNYLNGCAILDVQLSPHELLETLLQIEAKFGRIRREPNAPRTLDLDLLLFDDLILNTPRLTLPHPRMKKRAFVLVPLAEIAPNWIEPVSRKTITQLAQRVDWSGVHQL